jgi:hypothetical protein
MKYFYIRIFAAFTAIFLLIACSSADNKNSDKDAEAVTKKPTPAVVQPPESVRFTGMVTMDSNTKQFININVHNDTMLMKELITRLSKKDEKSIWEKLSPFLLALMPLILGYLGYRYAIRQIVAKQRLDWITSIRNLGSRLITEMVKSQVTFAEIYSLHEEFTNAETEVNNLQEEVSTIKKQKKAVDKDLSDKLELAKKRLEEIKMEISEAKVKYKSDFFVMYQLLNEMIINLDTTLYSSHRQLETAITDFRESLDIDNDQNPEELSQAVIERIKEVVSEQRRLAEGNTA